jgi:predicted amino acid-binding ACT domain protein
MMMMNKTLTMMAFVEPGHTEMDRREGSHCLQEYSKKQRN